MKFWLEMYQLNNFYSYLVANMLSIERSDKEIGNVYQELIELVENSNFYVRIRVQIYQLMILKPLFYINSKMKIRFKYKNVITYNTV